MVQYVKVVCRRLSEEIQHIGSPEVSAWRQARRGHPAGKPETPEKKRRGSVTRGGQGPLGSPERNQPRFIDNTNRTLRLNSLRTKKKVTPQGT